MLVKRSCTLPRNGRSLSELARLSVPELVALARSGERAAFGPLFEQFSDRLLANTVYRCKGDRALAEDIVSETWAGALASIERWQPRTGDLETDFRSWLFGNAKARVAAHYANHWREVAVDVADNDDVFGGPADGDDLGDAGVQPLRDRMLAAVDTLCPRQRDVLRMLLDGADTQETAECLGLTVPQVQGAKQTAEAQLRAQLADPLDTATVAQLRDAIALLPDPHRRIAYLRMVEGLGLRQIAEEVGIAYDRVLQIATRARISIRRTLAEPTVNGVGDLAAARAKRDRDLAVLRQAAQELPAGQREVALRRLDGMRFKEIAAELGKTHAGVDGAWRAAQNSLARRGALTDASTIPTPAAGDSQGNPLADLDAARTRRDRAKDAARAAAQSLPPAQREVALLRLEGLLLSEIGARLGKSKAAIQSAWRAGQASLAKRQSVLAGRAA